VGGDRTSQEARGQSDPLLSKTAEIVAKETGVSPSTVKRTGKFAAQKGIIGFRKWQEMAVPIFNGSLMAGSSLPCHQLLLSYRP